MVYYGCYICKLSHWHGRYAWCVYFFLGCGLSLCHGRLSWPSSVIMAMPLPMSYSVTQWIIWILIYFNITIIVNSSRSCGRCLPCCCYCLYVQFEHLDHLQVKFRIGRISDHWSRRLLCLVFSPTKTKPTSFRIGISVVPSSPNVLLNHHLQLNTININFNSDIRHFRTFCLCKWN